MSSRPRCLAGVVCATVALAVAHAPTTSAHRADPDVLVTALVMDAGGAPATGLSADDFDVRVDGTPVPATCAPDTRPLRLVVLVDISASMRMGDLMSGISMQRAMEQWIPYGLVPADGARFGTISKHLFLSDRFTADRHELLAADYLLRAPGAAERQGPSPIWDAIDGALDVLAPEKAMRAVLVLTDGRATGDHVGSRDVITHALALDSSIHVVAERDAPTMVPQADGSQLTFAPGLALRAIADNTGGLYVTDRPFPWSDPGPLFGRVLALLHHGYRLAFRPAIAHSGPHALDVRVKNPTLSVRARRTLPPVD